MLAVLYRWRVRAGHEATFRQAWREVTDDIRDNYGGGGSRLHRRDDGDYVAYARWPSREARDRAFSDRGALMKREPERLTPAQRAWPDICEEVEEIWLEITDDLLIPEEVLPDRFTSG